MRVHRHDHDKDHGTGFFCLRGIHNDNFRHPVTYMTCSRGCVILLRITGWLKKGQPLALAVYVPPKSILVMGGLFQEQFQHSILSFKEMYQLYLHFPQVTIDGWEHIVSWLDGDLDPFLHEAQMIVTKRADDILWCMSIRWMVSHNDRCTVQRKHEMTMVPKSRFMLLTDTMLKVKWSIVDVYRLVRFIMSQLQTSFSETLRRLCTYWRRYLERHQRLRREYYAKKGWNYRALKH